VKSKDRKRSDEVEFWKRRAVQKLSRLKGKALQRELERSVARTEKEMSVKLPRYSSAMVTPRRLRKAQ
jgi:hypothetical protein